MSFITLEDKSCDVIDFDSRLADGFRGTFI